MPSKKSPKLRTVQKTQPPFPLNQFPKGFGLAFGKEIIYLLATKGNPTLEGQEWESIFAKCIGAGWKPSNVGLDDVVLGNCAWGAKTLKQKSPSKAQSVRLISGRNSPTYSFGERNTDMDPDQLGPMILEIWNERVSSIRQKYKHLRTVVLIKSNTFDEFAIFEFDTIRYDPELYYWSWNNNNNLEGHSKNSEKHVFTWQPHGSQFTIIEEIPKNCLIIKVKKPRNLDKDTVLKNIGFDESWINVSVKDD